MREQDIDGSNIYSLTQTCSPDIDRSIVFLNEYLNYMVLSDEEIDLIPYFMRINWICCRTDGSYKVPEPDQWRFISLGIQGPLRWLDKNEKQLINAIKDIQCG